MGGERGSLNFGFLERHDPLLVSLGRQAERYFSEDPVTAVIKLRQFAEVLARLTAAHMNLPSVGQEQQVDLLQRLRNARALTPEVHELFNVIRRAGNSAVHEHQSSHREALHCLKLARELGVWFHRGFADPKFKAGPFVPPAEPTSPTKELQAELERLREALDKAKLTAEQQRAVAEDAELQRLEAEERAAKLTEERAIWEQLAQEYQTKSATAVVLAAREAAEQAPQQLQTLTEQLLDAGEALDLDEADTRALIDEQLRASGWEADTQVLRFSEGARPIAGKNRAIAEWPAGTGRADYVLFVGLTAVGVVEAKRSARNVAGSLDQSRRYSREFRLAGDAALAEGSPWGDFKVPFLFATNGRAWFEQLKEYSGIWFHDARRPTSAPRPLMGWPTPQGLKEELKHDVDAATKKLEEQSAADLPGLRPYQLAAIRSVEKALAEQKRKVMVAMATGTGKTRTFIGLIYRLVKTGRFRRILFLVDRNALGEQASRAFENELVEGAKPFAKIFDVKGLEDLKPAPETRLHFATVQAVARRLFGGDDGPDAMHVDDYDCIVVDECHRGYTLDKELSAKELTFRDEEEYLSVYRRVLDFFDAVKIGLTATPAKHTTEIFGAPVYRYTYREAVVEGFLVDHEPPISIETRLATEGIHFTAGEQVTTWNPAKRQEDFVFMKDEVDFEVDAFNRQVRTENFNKVVCKQLAEYISPLDPLKTLIFCSTDEHADMVVRLLSAAFAERYGPVHVDTVKKITGASDRPNELIRRFRNEKRPAVGVTVDLLTTGIDVPSIGNLVFLRRVRSRILYEQMLGRATRLYRDGDFVKETFRVYDAVGLYAALQDVTEMKPVVVNPSHTFAQLARELAELTDDEARTEVARQLLGKLQRKKRHFTKGKNAELFSAAADGDVDEVVERLVAASPRDLAQWLQAHPKLVVLLDRVVAQNMPVYVSHHADEVVSVRQGFGEGREKPEDYLTAFQRYLEENENRLEALKLVMRKPRDLTRADLRRLKLELDEAGYSEANLRAAYHATTNADVAASIMGFIRQRALGDPLRPYALRVDDALQRVLASKAWKPPQVQWLKRIAKAIKENEVVDRPLLDEGAFRDHGGFTQIDLVFEGKLEKVVEELKDEVWRTA